MYTKNLKDNLEAEKRLKAENQKLEAVVQKLGEEKEKLSSQLAVLQEVILQRDNDLEYHSSLKQQLLDHIRLSHGLHKQLHDAWFSKILAARFSESLDSSGNTPISDEEVKWIDSFLHGYFLSCPLHPEVVKNPLQDRLISYQPLSYTLPQNPAEFLESLDNTIANIPAMSALAQPADGGTRVSHYHLDYGKVDRNGLDYLFRLIDAPDRGPTLFAGFPFCAKVTPGSISVL